MVHIRDIEVLPFWGLYRMWTSENASFGPLQLNKHLLPLLNVNLKLFQLAWADSKTQEQKHIGSTWWVHVVSSSASVN